ncbi:hypothetical protein [Rhodococcus artemisiae]|uniref:Uncharacterized protein n=1 Tax=Rhodococcus artemisiae TaxID=714159 RepID=A0ABU7LBR5_9NOCA|nr:hypothetical protein [Rhodococcus artemisiae]MEE2058960.1 hypothetical protein [Rhodococcus artemisiae]
MLHPSIEARLRDLRNQLRTARFAGDDPRITIIERAIDRELDRANGCTDHDTRMDKRRHKNADRHEKNLGLDQ